MKRYLVFSHEDYYPMDGTADVVVATDDIYTAKSLDYFYCRHGDTYIVDLVDWQECVLQPDETSWSDWTPVRMGCDS